MEERLTSFNTTENGLLLQTDIGHGCFVGFVTDRIVRVKYCFTQDVHPLFSYSVIAGQEPNRCEAVNGEYRLLPTVAWTQEETGEEIRLSSRILTVRISRSPFAISVCGRDSEAYHADIAGYAYEMDGNRRRNHHFALDDYTGFYGLGEKTGPLNKFKRRYRMYCCDTLGYDAETTDPLYKHIPFFIKRSEDGKRFCGVFYDNPSSGAIDLGCERSGYWPPYAGASFDAGDIEYYIITGERFRDVVRGYALLTGTTALPTYASLGYMASTMYYTEQEENCDQGIEKFIREMESQGFPCDGFHLSSGYTTQNGKRCVFQWNKKRFPDPKGFFDWMRAHGIFVSANVKPALLESHPLYNEFAEGKAFLIDANTGKPHRERYWGGMASLVDFSSAEGCGLWKKHLKESLLSLGADAVWDDNNEYELTGGAAACAASGISAPAMKPVFANLMAKCGREAIQEVNPGRRPYILSRSGYAGIQRYAQTWAGDNSTSWKTLRYNIATVLGMGLSGVANNGCDIGGFYGPAPDAELFVRWVENGIFQPRFSIHSCNTDNTVTQPWSYTGYTPLIKSAVQLRYSLGLYLYSCFRISNRLGDPVMRPLAYEFENDPVVRDEGFAFLFGPYLLVSNVLEAGAVSKTVYLPKGTDWYDWHTHRRFAGGTTVTVDAPLGRIPLFYRCGSIIPLLAPATHMRMSGTREATLLIEASEPGGFTLYQDDGESDAWRDGDFRETEIRVQPNDERIVISFQKSGAHADVTKEYAIRLVGRKTAPLRVLLGETALPLWLDRSDFDGGGQGAYYELSTHILEIRFQQPAGDFTVTADYSIQNLIDM